MANVRQNETNTQNVKFNHLKVNREAKKKWMGEEYEV